MVCVCVILPINFQGSLQGSNQDFGHTTISNLKVNTKSFCSQTVFLNYSLQSNQMISNTVIKLLTGYWLENAIKFSKQFPVFSSEMVRDGLFLGIWRLVMGARDRGDPLFPAGRVFHEAVQVWPLTHFFLFPFCEKNHSFASRVNQWPLVGKTLFSTVPLSNSLVFVLDPLRAFWADTVPI